MPEARFKRKPCEDARIDPGSRRAHQTFGNRTRFQKRRAAEKARAADASIPPDHTVATPISFPVNARASRRPKPFAPQPLFHRFHAHSTPIPRRCWSFTTARIRDAVNAPNAPNVPKRRPRLPPARQRLDTSCSLFGPIYPVASIRYPAIACQKSEGPVVREVVGSPDRVQTVLLVEDDKTAGRATAWLLTSQGYQVTWAQTVAKGVAALSPRPDLLLLDLMLPDGHGGEVLLAARQRGEPPVTIVITAAERPMIDEVMALRPQLVLRKPLDGPALLRWMRDLAARRPADAAPSSVAPAAGLPCVAGGAGLVAVRALGDGRALTG